MKIAAAAYPLDFLADWDAYAAKLSDWVATGAATGAELLVFPEYGAMELASLGGAVIAADLETALDEVMRHAPRVADCIATWPHGTRSTSWARPPRRRPKPGAR